MDGRGNAIFLDGFFNEGHDGGGCSTVFSNPPFHFVNFGKTPNLNCYKILKNKWPLCHRPFVFD